MKTRIFLFDLNHLDFRLLIFELIDYKFTITVVKSFFFPSSSFAKGERKFIWFKKTIIVHCSFTIFESCSSHVFFFFFFITYYVLNWLELQMKSEWPSANKNIREESFRFCRYGPLISGISNDLCLVDQWILKVDGRKRRRFG